MIDNFIDILFPWVMMWGFMVAIGQWGGCLIRHQIALSKNEVDKVSDAPPDNVDDEGWPPFRVEDEDLPFEIEVPWYVRPLFGLPPTRGKIVLKFAAEVQIASILCAGIQWLWLSWMGWLDDPEMQSTTLGYTLLFIFWIVIAIQRKILIYIFSKK